MENLSELVTSYDALGCYEEPTNPTQVNENAPNHLEEVANTQIPPLPQEASDNQIPSELHIEYQTQNPTKRISRRGLIAGGIISGLAILLYKGYDDKANARITETKLKTREENERKKKLEEQRERYARQEKERKELEEDIEMHKLTDSEFAEYMRINKIGYEQKSNDERKKISTIEKKINAIKKNPSKALSLMDNSSKTAYESFKREYKEFCVYFLKIKEDGDKDFASRDLLGEFLLLPTDMIIQGTFAGLGLDPDYAPNLGDHREPNRKKEASNKRYYMYEYNDYNSEFRGLTPISSNLDEDLIPYFYYTRYKGGMFNKKME